MIDLCELVTDGSHHSPPSQVEGYYMASVKDMGAYKFIYSDCRKISEEDYDKLVKSGCSPKNEDILIAKDGSPLSNIFIYQEEYPMVLLSSIAIIRTNKNKILPEFLKYYLENPSIKKYIQTTYTSGSVIPRIILKDFKKFPINYPDIANQKKIIGVLKSIDEKIAINEEINKNLEQLMKCVFDEWFVNFNYSNDVTFKSSELGEIPYNWEVKTLGDLLDTLESGKRPKGGISEIKDGIPSIGAENILGLGKFNYSKNKLISHDFFNKLKKGIIQDQDVLLYKDGAQLGRKSLFMNGFPFDTCCINEHVFRLRSNDEISQFYLYLWLDQPIMTNEIINLNSNSAQPGINQTDVKSLPILVPNLEIMDKFNKIISPMMNQIFDNALEVNKLSQLRDTLLPNLMSGEIDVSKINCYL